MTLGDKQLEHQNEAVVRKARIRFFIVMLLFTIGMVFLLIYEISAWWIWYLYLAIWTFIEYQIGKQIRLKWWWWVIIIIALLTLDWVVIEMVEYFKGR